MANFTKGDWKVVENDEICAGNILVAGTFEPGVYVLPAAKKMKQPTVEECRANAQLMAASPKLYKAVQVALELFINPGAFDVASVEHLYKEAIAAAEGRR